MMQGKGAGSGWDMRAEVEAALPFVRGGGTVLDVGANKGEWSRAILAERPTARIVLFEPQESCVPYLESLGTLVRAAVGDTNGSATLYSPGDGAGNASLYERRDTYWEEDSFKSISVAQVTIDAASIR
jgi:FkbM family methyltransferase